MLKSGQKRPNTPNKIQRATTGYPDLDHWRQGVCETVITAKPDGSLNFAIRGGSDSGEFAYVSDIVQTNVSYVSGVLNEEDVVLEIQGQKVAGYTQRDVVAWLNHCSRNGNPVVLKTIQAASITKDLRQFLNTRFQKGSVDHDLQNTIRDNLYLRTVPVTTRIPRDGEVNGVDYTFLSPDEFMELERSGSLLESGIYEGNHYGTPKPSQEAPVSPPQSNWNGSKPSVLIASLFPGAHPSSEGKRKRNRSNVEAMAAKNMEPESLADNSFVGDGGGGGGERQYPAGVGAPPSYFHAGDGHESLGSDLGPLPSNWEKAYTERGEVYFIDHNSGTSHWLDPRLSKFQKKSLEECLDDELPYGWEKIDDPHYGTYFIDHVNRRTQYENPVIQAKSAAQDSGVPGSSETEDSNNYLQYRKAHNALPVSQPNGNNHSRSSPKRPNRLNMYLPCIPCLATDTKQPVLPKVQAAHTFVKAQDPQSKGGAGSVQVNPLQNLSSFQSKPSQEKSPSLNQTIVPRFAQPSFPAYAYGYTNVPRPAFRKMHPFSVPNLMQVQPDRRTHPHRLSAPLSSISDPFYNRMTSEGYINGLANTKLMQHKTGTPDYERAFFTRNPKELGGQRITATIVKSARGLGFTIVGGDDAEEEFLQIKSVVEHGQAWLDGKLRTGDVLVYVNETCVLGYTHHDMVAVFQSILPSETVGLEVCRGYPLPFDPDDPYTQVVTTSAVNAPGDPTAVDASVYVDGDAHFLDLSSEVAHNGSEDLANSSVKSMPDLCVAEKPTSIRRPNSTDVLLGDLGELGELGEPSKPEFLTICIVKGAMGFGFTIADSAYGQKVKKILDRQRCKNLMEGDILVDINAINVRDMCHGEVVQVLKDCDRNREATVTVQRGGPGSPGKNKARKKEALYRSKTPTADLYSTRKEVMPTRPKTPVVDTRNRSKTPTWPPDEWKPDERYDGFKTAFPYPNVGSPMGGSMGSPMGGLGERLSAMTMQSPHVDYNRSRSPANQLEDDAGAGAAAAWNKSSAAAGGQMHLDGYAENPGHSPGVFDHATADPMARPPSTDYLGHYASQQTHYYNGYEPYGYADGYAQGYSHKEMSKFAQHGAPNAGHNAGNLSADGQHYSSDENKRKESTSFEHEQPHPSNVTRFPRDLRWVGLGPGVRVYPAGPGLEWVETLITLVRQESGFGFRIVGGTEEGSQVSIGHIVPGGAADLDGRLCTGDEIVSVDAQSVLCTSHHHVVQLMGQAAANGRVTLGIRRRIPTRDVTSYARPDIGYPYDITVSRRESEGFGFVIISSVNKAGSTIGRIIEGSPAERCGQLHVGDRILAVNHIDIMNLHHGDIVNLIKESGYTVTLTIGPPLDDGSSTASVSQREDDGMGGDEEQYHAVELSRGTRGFGFSIRGGREFHNMPLFVLQIAENGPAAIDGRLKIGDQIIEINGINTKSMTHGEAIEIIRNGGPSVRLLVRRGDEASVSAVNANAASAGAGARPGSGLGQSNGPAGHSPLCDPNDSYWDDMNQSCSNALSVRSAQSNGVH